MPPYTKSTSYVPLEHRSYDASGRLAWITTFISMTAIALNVKLGTGAAIVFLLVWLLYALPAPFLMMRQLLSQRFIWLMPIMALLSTLWSVEPQITLRAGSQLVLTVSVAILMAKNLKPANFISATMASTAVVCLLSILFGGYSVDQVTNERTFIGLFASKNQLAFMAMLLAISAIAVALDKKQHGAMRYIACLALIIVPPLLIVSRSGTSRLTAVLAIFMLLSLLVFLKLTAVERAFTAVIALIILSPSIVFLASGVGAELVGHLIQDVLGKDLTLTGRTELWHLASYIVQKNPLIGQGFGAFWVQGNVEAEGIWRKFFVLSRSGFHFHNLFVEMSVQLGQIGLVCMAIFLMLCFRRLIICNLRTPSIPLMFLLTLFVVMMLRSIVEYEVFSAFSIGTIVLYATTTFAHDASKFAKIEKFNSLRSRSDLIRSTGPLSVNA